jgi:hypothetical protein
LRSRASFEAGTSCTATTLRTPRNTTAMENKSEPCLAHHPHTQSRLRLFLAHVISSAGAGRILGSSSIAGVALKRPLRREDCEHHSGRRDTVSDSFPTATRFWLPFSSSSKEVRGKYIKMCERRSEPRLRVSSKLEQSSSAAPRLIARYAT